MALIAQELIQEARDWHPAFDDRRHPDRVLLRRLSSFQRDLVSRALEANNEAIATALEIPFPLADFDAGETLPAYHFLHAGEVVFPNETKAQLTLIPWSHRLDPAPFYSAFTLDDQLYFRGKALDWNNVVKVVLQYAPVPADLAALTDTLVLPDPARTALVSELAYFMGRRTPKVDGQPPIPAELRAEAMEARDRWLIEIGRRRQAQTIVVRDVL